jgi:hypothetical protein
MFRALAGRDMRLAGHTVLLVDVSGSMESPIARQSEMRRADAAYGLAILLREVAEKVTIYTFSENARLVPARRGMALRDALDKIQPPAGTYLGLALRNVEEDCRHGYDRLVVITDEQSHDQVSAPRGRGCPLGRGYVVNVASNRNGVGYGEWTHIDGWSEAVVDYIAELSAAMPLRAAQPKPGELRGICLGAFHRPELRPHPPPAPTRCISAVTTARGFCHLSADGA